MVRIVPAAIKLPTFVIDPDSFIDEPCIPTVCRESTCRQQTISDLKKIDSHTEGTLHNTLQHSILEKPAWHPASNSPLNLLQQKVFKLGETPCDLNSESCSWDMPAMCTFSTMIKKKELPRDGSPTRALVTPRCWTERFVVSLDELCDTPYSIPKQTESDGTGISNSEADNTNLLSNLTNMSDEAAADAALFEMEKKQKDSLAIIEALEMKLVEQEKKLAAAAAVRAEILEEVRRDQEERMEQYYAVIEKSNQRRARRAKTAPDWLFGACYTTEDPDEVLTITF